MPGMPIEKFHHKDTKDAKTEIFNKRKQSEGFAVMANTGLS
jgi:hypothetical protein